MAPLGTSAQAQTKDFTSPDILILGDSQITFGSGPAFLNFFTNIKQHCTPNRSQSKLLKRLGKMTVSVIGVRSTSIHSWTARSGKAKNAVCKVDPKWKVNAGSYGFVNMSDDKFVQIGQGKEYQFCSPNKSPFEAMFRTGYYEPKLLLLSFLGNSAKRWASDKNLAVRDIQAMMHQLPPNTPCIVMTTAPTYAKKNVDLRLKAQLNLQQALEETHNSCSFVPGLTPETIAANQGNTKYFKLNKNGKVKDPFHPNHRAAKNFFALEMDDICNAIFDQIKMTTKSG